MNSNFLKNILLPLYFISLCFCLESFSTPIKCSEEGVVTWIVDGDTIIVRLQNGSEKIRMLGIDTPEFKNNTHKTEYYAYEAFKYTKEQLKGKKICLVKDPSNDRDRYGRMLRYVYIDSRFFNAELLRKGYADIFSKSEHKMKTYFMKLLQEARNSGIGMWGSMKKEQ